MQKTTHLHLNTWVEADPVSLAEMNENFALLDADAAAKTASVSRHKDALKTLAQHEAHRALEAYHAGTLSGAKDNLILADFSKPDDWSDVSGVRITQNAIQNADSSYVGYEKELSSPIYLSESEWRVIDRFEALQSGNLTAVCVDVRENAAPTAVGRANIRIKDGDTVVAEYANCCAANQPHFENCPIAVGHSYVVEAMTDDSIHQISIVGTFGITVAPTASQGGYVITKEIDCAGSTLCVWVHGTGAAPTVSAISGGTTQTLNAVGSKAAADLSGGSATAFCYACESFLQSRVKIKVQLTGQASISAVCGVVL